MKATSTRNYAVLHVLIGLALMSAVDDWNKAGVINWGTVFTSLVGLVLVISGVLDFFSKKNS